MWTTGDQCEPLEINVNHWRSMWTTGDQCEPLGINVHQWGLLWTDVAYCPPFEPQNVHLSMFIVDKLANIGAGRFEPDSSRGPGPNPRQPVQPAIHGHVRDNQLDQAETECRWNGRLGVRIYSNRRGTQCKSSSFGNPSVPWYSPPTVPWHSTSTFYYFTPIVPWHSEWITMLGIGYYINWSSSNKIRSNSSFKPSSIKPLAPLVKSIPYICKSLVDSYRAPTFD